MHPDLAWIPTWLTAAPSWPILAAANRLWDIPGTDRWRETRFVPKPAEPNAVWAHWMPDFASESASPAEVATAGAALGSLVTRIKRYQGKPRYLGKMVGRPVKVELLARTFPEAKFVVVTRDLKPTVSSLLLVDFFQNNAPLADWPWGEIPHSLLEWYEAAGRPEEIAAAITVILNKAALDRQISGLARDRWIEVRYRSFVDDPIAEIHRISDHAGLAMSRGLEERFRARDIRGGPDDKWARHLGAEQIARLDRFEETFLAEVGG